MPRMDRRDAATRASGDVSEVLDYCEDCQERRTFRLVDMDLAGYDAADLNPVLQDAVNGEATWRCPVCGRIEPDLVNRKGYDYEWRDSGYEVGQWRDAELADEQEGGPPRSEEWDDEESMEPRGRGVHLDRMIARQESVRAPDREGEDRVKGPVRKP